MRSYLSLACLVFLTNCSSVPVLKMEQVRAPIDESVASPAFKVGSLKKLMVVAPANNKGNYDGIISAFEKELLRNGVVVISGAVTSRVAGDQSDVEKALVLAKKSGADAILQIGEWAWAKEVTPKRFFVFDGEKTYNEVNGNEFQATNSLKYSFPSSELRFVGRLINTESGEVVASFEIKSPANYNLPYTYVAQVAVEDEKPVLKSENFAYTNSSWFADARKATEVSIVKSVCNRLMNGANAPATIVAAPKPAGPVVAPATPVAPAPEPPAPTQDREVAAEEKPAPEVAAQPAEEETEEN